MLELQAACGILHEVYEKHAADESHGAENADGREVFDGILTVDFEGVVCNRVGDGDGGHVECHADCIQGVERPELYGFSGVHGVETGSQHEQGGDTLADRKHFLCGNPLVGNDAHEGWHEYGYKALRGEEQPDLGPQPYAAEEAAHAGEVGPPDSVLEEIHQYQPESDV